MVISPGRGDFRPPSPLDTILRDFPCGNSWRSLLLLEATVKPLEKALIVRLKWISSPTVHLLVSGLCLLRMPGAPCPMGLRGASQINQPDKDLFSPFLGLFWFLPGGWPLESRAKMKSRASKSSTVTLPRPPSAISTERAPETVTP